MIKGNVLAVFGEETRRRRPMLSKAERAEIVKEYDPVKVLLLLYALAGFPAEADLSQSLSDPEREAAWEEFGHRVRYWHQRLSMGEVPSHFASMLLTITVPTWEAIRREMENLSGQEVLVGLLRGSQPIPVHGNGKTVMVH